MNKEYKNVSQTEILGHSPGTTFTADLPESQEISLLEGGGLEIVGDVAPETTSDGDGQEPIETTDENEQQVEPVVETPAPESGRFGKGK